MKRCSDISVVLVFSLAVVTSALGSATLQAAAPANRPLPVSPLNGQPLAAAEKAMVAAPGPALCRKSVIVDLGNGICLWDATLCPSTSQTLYASCSLLPNPCVGNKCSAPSAVGNVVMVEQTGSTSSRSLFSNVAEIAVKPLSKVQADALAAKNGWTLANKSFVKVTNDGKRYDFVIFKAYKAGNDDQRFGMRLSEEVAEAKEVTSATPLSPNEENKIREIGVFPAGDDQVFHLHLADIEWVTAR